MKFALVNPDWDFSRSIYFGCRQPHYPLELLFAHDQIQLGGHDVCLIDAHSESLDLQNVRSTLCRFAPDFLVIPTAPTYLFWRCPPPELRVPRLWFNALSCGAVTVAIGPHSSATPATTLRKLDCEVVLRGEPDQTLPQLASQPWSEIAGCCWRSEDGDRIAFSPSVTEMTELPALTFANYNVEGHLHRHHVFSGQGRGAELEFARGCPWTCSFCNKTLFRNKYRERNIASVLSEVDRLLARGVTYIYFIDEIFGVGRNAMRLLAELAQRPVSIGLQTRIDLWSEETLDLLGQAHCISMECGIESVTEEGRDELNKKCRLSTDRLSELLIYARRRIPWVQANLILTERDRREDVRHWQQQLKAAGVWVSEPVPMFPFPGTPVYQRIFGTPDEYAWERAHNYYTRTFHDQGYSDIQEAHPASLEELECTS